MVRGGLTFNISNGIICEGDRYVGHVMVDHVIGCHVAVVRIHESPGIARSTTSDCRRRGICNNIYTAATCTCLMMYRCLTKLSIIACIGRCVSIE